MKSYKKILPEQKYLSFEQSIIIFEFNLQQSAFHLDIFLLLPQYIVNNIGSKNGIFCNFLDLDIFVIAPDTLGFLHDSIQSEFIRTFMHDLLQFFCWI